MNDLDRLWHERRERLFARRRRRHAEIARDLSLPYKARQDARDMYHLLDQ